jgi:bifunctional non-homologous end joining protein LigD
MTADEMREMQWVRPELVAQIRFVEWTAEGRVMHAAFLGLRSDKGAREVRREAKEVTS